MKRLLMIVLVLYAIVTLIGKSGNWTARLGEDGKLYILTSGQTAHTTKE